MTDLKEKLCSVIDPRSKAVCSLARTFGKDVEETFGMLSDAYDEAIRTDTLLKDGDGYHFETEFASIDLVLNLDYSSRYERFMRYELKTPEGITFTPDITERIVPKAEELPDADDYPLPGSFSEISVPQKMREILMNHVAGRLRVSQRELADRLDRSYRSAVKYNAMVKYETGYNFDTDIPTVDGFVFTIGIRPMREADRNSLWIVNYVGWNPASRHSNHVSAIYEFASFGNAQWLYSLMETAADENWYPKGSETPEILKNYISYTFYRLQRENKIEYSGDKGFAAFNTGLTDPSYEDIFMMFSKQPDNDRWIFEGVCTAGNGYLGKILVGHFASLPKRAGYLNGTVELLIDTSASVHPDYSHIIPDRIHRLPLPFLEYSFFGNSEALERIEQIRNASDEALPLLYAELKDYLKRNPQAAENLKMNFSAALDKTLKRLKSNYRLAIPCYYPKKDSMCFLLPLDLLNTGRPQIALVTERTANGGYIGPTVLTLQSAYVDARLVCRQEGSWLEP